MGKAIKQDKGLEREKEETTMGSSGVGVGVSRQRKQTVQRA